MGYYSKSFYVGEFDWTGANGGADLDTFYSTIENMEGSGSMMWSLFTHGKCLDSALLSFAWGLTSNARLLQMRNAATLSNT